MKKFLAIVLIWGLVLGGVAVAYKQLLMPEQSEPLPKVNLALDSFSGYCIFRSPEFKQKLAAQDLDFTWVDDKADYAKRMESLRNGTTPLAVFTIDALIEQTPRAGDPPAAIIMLIDESRGADAIISYKKGIPNIAYLDDPSAKIIMVRDSPSETLLRVTRDQFKLKKLDSRKKEEYLIGADSVEDVYKKFLNTSKDEPTAFVLWEPFVSKALNATLDSQPLVDSSRFNGRIVDVLVAQQAYLRQHPDRVQMVVRTYLEMLHERQRKTTGMADEVFEDAPRVGENLTREEADQVAKEICWKNTVDNYAHFRLLKQPQAGGLLSVAGGPLPVGQMIKEIAEVLDKTKEPGAPQPGVDRPDKLVDDGALRRLSEMRPPLHLEQQIRAPALNAPPLSDDEWNNLRPVGSLFVKPVPFQRNTAKPEGDEWEKQLDQLGADLEPWPNYYLRVEGHTTKGQVKEADLELAEQRAHTVEKYLKEQKLAGHRIHAVAMPSTGFNEVRLVILQAR